MCLEIVLLPRLKERVQSFALASHWPKSPLVSRYQYNTLYFTFFFFLIHLCNSFFFFSEMKSAEIANLIAFSWLA